MLGILPASKQNNPNFISQQLKLQNHSLGYTVYCCLFKSMFVHLTQKQDFSLLDPKNPLILYYHTTDYLYSERFRYRNAETMQTQLKRPKYKLCSRKISLVFDLPKLHKSTREKKSLYLFSKFSKFKTSIILMVTFLYFFFRSAHVSSLSCFPVFGLYTKKSFFLGFTSFTRIAVFLLFLIWKRKTSQKLFKFKHADSIYLQWFHTVFFTE